MFDSISGNPKLNLAGTPRTFMGQDFTAADPGGPLLGERVVLYMAAASALGGDSALAIQIYAAEIPEPGTFGLAGGCLLLLVRKLRRN